MESDSTHPGCTKPAFTTQALTIRSGPPILKKPDGSRQSSQSEEAEQRQQAYVRGGAAAASCSPAGRTAVLSMVGTVEGLDDSCPSPVIHDRRTRKVVAPIGLGGGFEESPGWRQYYESSSESAKVEGLYLHDHPTGWLSDQSLANTKSFSTETVITTETLSDWHSPRPTKVGSKSRLLLPRPNSGGYLLKAGNNRLRQLMRPKNKIYFRTQPVVPQDQPDIGAQIQKPEWTASNKPLSKKRSKSWMETTVKQDGTSSRRLIRNKESSASIVDLNQVEARHGLEEYHRAALSESWDEIFQNIGGFRVDSAIGDDSVHGKGPGAASTDLGAIRPDLPLHPGTSGRCDIGGSRHAPIKTPPLPGPRTSSTIRTVEPSPPRPKFEVVVAALPSSPAPNGQLTPESASHDSSLTETDMNDYLDEESLRLSREDTRSRSLKGLPEIRPAREASPATIALEVIEAEMAHEPPLSLSMLTDLTQPFSINCTPPQPAIAPSKPPVGPLPELPDEFDKAHAASRGLSHPPFPTSAAPPPVPPRSPHFRDPTVASTGPDLAPQLNPSPKDFHSQRSGLSSQSPKSTRSTGSAQCIPTRRDSRPRHSSPELAWPMDNKSSVVGFDRNGSGGSHDLPSPAASDTGHESDMPDHSKSAAAADAPASGVRSSRSERIRQLKLRDLAKEKARKTCIRQPGSERNQSSVAGLVFGGPSNYPSQMNAEGSWGVGGRRDSINRRRGHLPRRKPSHKAYQRTVGPVMGPSQIMVLAETEPETQMFRASTSTGSIPRTDKANANVNANARANAESMAMANANERKVRKYKCSGDAFPQLDATAVAKRMTGIKPNNPKPKTPPRAAPSTHPSDDDDDGDGDGDGDDDDENNDDDDDGIDRWRDRRCSPGVDPITALVREDSDIESSAPSKRGIAALARQEEKRYLEEQQLRWRERVKRENFQLRLAMRLLSLGLEKLTTFVELKEEMDVRREHGSVEAETEPLLELAERFARSLGVDDPDEL